MDDHRIRKKLTAGSNEQDTTTHTDNHSPPCFQSFQDDRSHGQRGRLFTKSRSRSPVRDAAVPLELGDTQVMQLEPGDTQAVQLEPGDTQAVQLEPGDTQAMRLDYGN